MVAVPVASPQPGCEMFKVYASIGGSVISAAAVKGQAFNALTVSV